MILLLSLTLLTWADGGPGSKALTRPEPPLTVDGECKTVLPMPKGQPLPEGLRISHPSAPCSAVVVPLSDYADLLATEKWGEAIAQQYRVDVAALEMERDWYKSKLEAESEPLPWLLRPETQRWFGRIETLITVGVVAAGFGAAYSYGAGATK